MEFSAIATAQSAILLIASLIEQTEQTVFASIFGVRKVSVAISLSKSSILFLISLISLLEDTFFVKKASKPFSYRSIAVFPPV